MSVEAHREVLEKWNGLRLNVGSTGENDKLERGSWVVVARRGEDVHGDDTGKTAEDDGEIVGFVVTELLPVVHAVESDCQAIQTQTETQTKTIYTESYFLHINELSIASSHQRRGLARRLLATVKGFAVRLSTYPSESSTRFTDSSPDHRSSADQPKPRLKILGLSLTTFRDVPFNASFYEKFGFREVERGDIEEVIGEQGMRIWREDCERFEGEVDGMADGEGGRGGGEAMRRCWMICCL